MENFFRADLHCHSTFSDGTSSPREIIDLSKLKGLSGLSITDHDTIEAYEEAIPYAQEKNLKLISGVEFSCVHKDISVHMLAYCFPLKHTLIKNYCLKHKTRRADRNREIIQLLKKHNFIITEQDILNAANSKKSFDESTLGRPHIAVAMLKKGYVESISDAFNKYLGEGKPCYDPGKAFSLEETLQLVHETKALAIIAHPHLIKNTGFFKKLLEMDFDGIECYYAHFDKSIQQKFIRIAENKNWLVTGGSDYHGEIKPNNHLGSSWIDEERFDILESHFIQNTNEYQKYLEKINSIKPL